MNKKHNIMLKIFNKVKVVKISKIILVIMQILNKNLNQVELKKYNLNFIIFFFRLTWLQKH